MHPPYSAEQATSDYYLLLSMANDFAGEKFASRTACENRRLSFLSFCISKISNKTVQTSYIEIFIYAKTNKKFL